MKRCAYSCATCVLPTPPWPCSATGRTTAVLLPISWSCSLSSTSLRPVKEAFLVGTRHTGGIVRGYLGSAASVPSTASVSFGG